MRSIAATPIAFLAALMVIGTQAEAGLIINSMEWELDANASGSTYPFISNNSEQRLIGSLSSLNSRVPLKVEAGQHSVGVGEAYVNFHLTVSGGISTLRLSASGSGDGWHTEANAGSGNGGGAATLTLMLTVTGSTTLSFSPYNYGNCADEINRSGVHLL